MRKGLVAIAAAAALAGCNRQSTYETPRATGAPSAPADDTWVAQPTDLTDEQVRVVQRALTTRGFQVDATGTFDAATQTALADFQRSRGLPATGNLNADTAAALGIPPDDVRPGRVDRTMTAEEGARPAGDATRPADTASRPAEDTPRPAGDRSDTVRGDSPPPEGPQTAPSTTSGASAADR